MGRPKGKSNGAARSRKKRRTSNSSLNEVTVELQEENEILQMEADDCVGTTEAAEEGDEVSEVPSHDIETSEKSPPVKKKLQIPENSNPIPMLLQKSWTAKWRLLFYEDFRQTPKGKVYAVCKLCGPVQYFTANTTSYSNLSNHIIRVHSDSWEKYMKNEKPDTKQSSITSYANSKKTSKHRKQQLDTGLVVMLAGANLPLSFFPKPFFYELGESKSYLDHDFVYF